MDLFFRLYNKGLVSDLIIIKHKGEIKAKKFIISQKYLKKNYQMSKYWIEAWHGTKLEYLESIIQYGLKKPGTELSNASMTPQPKFELIDKNGEIDGIKNWPDAIFASPRILCASDPYYSERIKVKNQIWCCLLDVKIKPNNFTKHQSSEVRIWVDTSHPKPIDIKDDIIYRVSDEDNIIVVAITFLLYSFEGYETDETIFNEASVFKNLTFSYEDELVL